MPHDAADLIYVIVLAHNEERRIVHCLDSLPLSDPKIAIHVVVNGSRDATETLARSTAATATNVTVHAFSQGGKSRNWNRIVHDQTLGTAAAWVFVDGDAEVAPGSVEALVSALASQPHANAAAAMPLNGRKADRYRAEMQRTHGMFGDLYALRGSFVERMRAAEVRLPDDVIGDDGLVGALAKTDLEPLDNWDDTRVAVCTAAGFFCDPVKLTDPRSWPLQYRRMINYSVRHFQNQIITAVLRGQGPLHLPRELATLHSQYLPRFAKRPGVWNWWFDRVALRRMRSMVADVATRSA